MRLKSRNPGKEIQYFKITQITRVFSPQYFAYFRYSHGQLYIYLTDERMGFDLVLENQPRA